MDIEKLLEDQRNEAVPHLKNEDLVHENLCTDLEGAHKCLTVEDFFCSINDCNRSFDDLVAAQAVDQELNSKYEFLDDVLQVDQERLRVPPLLDDCSDYFMDTSFSGGSANFGYHSYQVDDTENLGTNNHYTIPLSNEHDDNRKSELPESIIALPEAASEDNHPSEQNRATVELHDAFRFTFTCNTPAKHKNWPKLRLSHGLHVISTTGDSSKSLDKEQLSSSDGVVTRERAGNDLPKVFVEVADAYCILPDSGDIDRTSLTNKRLRKPTRRYIEELSEMKPRLNKQMGPFMKDSHDRFSEKRSSNQKPWKNTENMELVWRHDSLGGLGIQVPFVLRVRRGRPRRSCTPFLMDNSNENQKYMTVVPKRVHEPSRLELDGDSDDNISTVRTAKGGFRRKHHRSWTPQEVMRLVDGVARHGVGRWSRIKRLEFSASAHRTSVDLKDKWRNLLKACCAELQPKKLVEPRRRHTSISIPSSILMRVRELAAMHRKERQSAALQHAPASTVAPSGYKNVHPCHGGRTVQKRHRPLGF